MSEIQPSEEEMVQAIYEFAAAQMVNGASNSEVQASLVEKGLDQETAATVVANLEEMQTQAINSAAKKNMGFGALWCIGGTAVTMATYSAASEGGSYVVAWGAIVFGAIQFIRGLTQLK